MIMFSATIYYCECFLQNAMQGLKFIPETSLLKLNIKLCMPLQQGKGNDQ